MGNLNIFLSTFTGNQPNLTAVPASPANAEHTQLLLVAGGDEAAFRQLYEKWHPKVYSLAMYLTRSPFMSEEITQEVFVKIWNNRHQLTEIEYLASWIRTITRNTIINYLKAKAREKLALHDYLIAQPAHSEETADAVREREYSRLFREAIEHLPQQQKKVWRLTKEDGMTLAQAADEMNITRNTAKEHLARAMNTIRKKLDAHIELVVTAAINLFL